MIWWVLAIVLVTPIMLVGLLLWYSFVAMTANWIQALLVGMGCGAVVILGTAMQDGTDAENAQWMFVSVVAGTLILKVVHLYIEPRILAWRQPSGNHP